MCIPKVEDQDDIQNVPATVSGESEKNASPDQGVRNREKVQEKSSVNISASELPPHVLLEMPALSPTMVRI